MSGGFGDLYDDVVKPDPKDLPRATWAEDRFLNPTVPRAVQDDPDGSFHKGLQVTKPNGDPLKGLKKDQPIPLMLRPYQRNAMEVDRRLRALRWSRRTGKTFQIGVEAVEEALRDPNGQVLILAPAQNQVKVIFDDYIRPLLRAYRHRRSSKIGIDGNMDEVGRTSDFAIETDTQKPQELVLVGTDDHRASIRGMVMNDTARGQSASFMIIDEADYADTEDMQEVVAPIIMTRPNTRVLMVSTPSGRGDTFFRDAFSSDKWWGSHNTFKVLPHYDEELHARMAELAGGENTNAFKREYLAQWGSSTEGVFDQEKLEQSYIVSPYPLVMEDIDSRTRERSPMLAASQTNRSQRKLAHYEGVRPLDYEPSEIGGRSVFRPAYRDKGVVTVGTDWNEVAGMQTCMVWWPPESMIKNGEIEVSRFDYEDGAPDTTQRSKDAKGNPLPYVMGSANGDPGGPHDLRQARGILIWHGRLEAGEFSWVSAANRVCSIMGIDNFVDAWYVDKGYGAQVNQMVQQIMESEEWLADQDLLHQSEPIARPVIERIKRFHPERDPEKTGRRYETVRFGEQYPHRDIDFTKGDGMYKDVMINLVRRMVSQRRILFPYGYLAGFHDASELGARRTTGSTNARTGEQEESYEQVQDPDEIEENGADRARGDAFGGLVTQMQSTRIDGYTPKGRPRYTGDWHAVDGLMLATLAYWENFTQPGEGNMFAVDESVNTSRTQDIFSGSEEVSRAAMNNDVQQTGQLQEGPMSMPSYDDASGPLQAILDGRASAEEVGTSMDKQLRSASRFFSSNT